MMSPLLEASHIAQWAAIGCIVASIALRSKRTQLSLILLGISFLLMGAGAEFRVWEDVVRGQRLIAERAHEIEVIAREDRAGAMQLQSIATESLAIARSTGSPEVREKALKLVEEAVNLNAQASAPAPASASSHSERASVLGGISALVLVAAGCVMICLACVRPDLLTRRIAKPVASLVGGQ